MSENHVSISDKVSQYHISISISVCAAGADVSEPGAAPSDATTPGLCDDAPVVSRLVALLDSDNRELVYTTVGVLINLMTDPGKRSDFNSFGGIDK